MSSDSDLKSELSKLVQVMISKLPADKKLTAPVVKQLLFSRYSDKFPSSFVERQENFIASEIERHSRKSRNRESDEETSDRDDSEDSEESEESEDESDEDEDEEGSEDEEDDEDEEGSEDESGEDKQSRKRARDDETLLDSAPGIRESSGERCKEMLNCLRKVGYRVRRLETDESLESYLEYLCSEFKKHGMNPSECDSAAIKRYKVKREVELLQQDGAAVHLDRSARVGRGLTEVTQSAPAQVPTFKTSKFLDDD